MANYTSNYGLHQWEAADDFLRTDFNTDFGIIDEALGDKAEVVVGSYDGNGAAERLIDLGRTPAAVILCDDDCRMRDGTLIYGGIALREADTDGVFISEGGFTVVENGDIRCNRSSGGYAQNYRYIALFD